MPQLNLEHGDSKRADRIADSNDTKKTDKVKAAAEKEEKTLRSRLGDAFDKIADQRDARQDFELAQAIRDDKDAMAVGLVSFTRVVPFLRVPLLFFLGLLEPILAFWHVGGILIRRGFERRTRGVAPETESVTVSQAEWVDPLAT